MREQEEKQRRLADDISRPFFKYFEIEYPEYAQILRASVNTWKRETNQALAIMVAYMRGVRMAEQYFRKAKMLFDLELMHL